MKVVQRTHTQLRRLGLWLVDDPRRLAGVVMALSALATALALLGGMQPGLMVAPGSGGSGGGPG